MSSTSVFVGSSTCNSTSNPTSQFLAQIDPSSSGPLGANATSGLCGWNPYLVPADLPTLSKCCGTKVVNTTSSDTDPTTCGVTCLAYCGYDYNNPESLSDCLWGPAGWPSGWDLTCSGASVSKKRYAVEERQVATCGLKSTTSSASTSTTTSSSSSSTATSAKTTGTSSTSSTTGTNTGSAVAPTKTPSSASKNVVWGLGALFLVNACFAVLA